MTVAANSNHHPTANAAEWRKLYDDIGALLSNNALEPTPQNFEICYRYLTTNDGELNSRVERAIQGGGLTSVAIASIIAQRSVEISAEDMQLMSTGAQKQLETIMTIVQRSTDDVRDYGNQLEQSNAGLQSPDTSVRTLEDLVLLTRTMIDKSREVEDKLRQSAAEINTLRRNLDEARKRADTDPLTGLPNRSCLDRRLAEAIAKAKAAGAPLCVGIVDIDRFKSINDTHGHLVGDEVIKFVASSLVKKGSDRLFVARFGGEEFVVLFENESPDDAAAELNEIRERVSRLELKITSTGAKLGKVTFSAGVAQLAGRDGASAILKAADTALYRAKNDGRNRVNIALPTE